jgi:hypothetical protein
METSGDWDIWGKKESVWRNREEILKVFTTKELLDMIDEEEIQLYLRKKKLEKLKNHSKTKNQ